MVVRQATYFRFIGDSSSSTEIFKTYDRNLALGNTAVFSWFYNPGITYSSIGKSELATVEKVTFFIKETAINRWVRSISQVYPPHTLKTELSILIVFSA